MKYPYRRPRAVSLRLLASVTVAASLTLIGAVAWSGSSTAATCPAAGHVTYNLARAASPTPDQATAYTNITKAMDEGTGYYNCYTNITKSLNVTYDPAIPTADGNINGGIRFGSADSMITLTAMHEIAHTVGVGQAASWGRLVVNGVFTGTQATAEIRTISGDPAAVVFADANHFWPHGLNYASEGGTSTDLINHCLLVAAIVADLG